MRPKNKDYTLMIVHWLVIIAIFIVVNNVCQYYLPKWYDIIIGFTLSLYLIYKYLWCVMK